MIRILSLWMTVLYSGCRASHTGSIVGSAMRYITRGTIMSFSYPPNTRLHARLFLLNFVRWRSWINPFPESSIYTIHFSTTIRYIISRGSVGRLGKVSFRSESLKVISRASMSSIFLASSIPFVCIGETLIFATV